MAIPVSDINRLAIRTDFNAKWAITYRYFFYYLIACAVDYRNRFAFRVGYIDTKVIRRDDDTGRFIADLYLGSDGV